MAEVTAPGGGRWLVRRRWAPRVLGHEGPWMKFKRRHRATRDMLDLPDPGCAVDVGEGIIGGIALAILIVVFILVGLPALIALGELLLILLLGLLGVVGRVLFRRPWTVDALGPGGEHHEWRVVGWHASGAARDEVARHLEATGQPPVGL